MSDGGAKSPMGQPVNGSIDTGRGTTCASNSRSERACFLDDKLVHEATYPKRQPIYGVAGRRRRRRHPQARQRRLPPAAGRSETRRRRKCAAEGDANRHDFTQSAG